MRGSYNSSSSHKNPRVRNIKSHSDLPPLNSLPDQQEKEITFEEIRILQLKKESLMQENRDLKDKIERIRSMMQNPEDYPEIAQYHENARRETRKIDTVIEERQIEYENYQNSDLVKEIGELQTELVIVGQEVVRQKEEKKKVDKNLKELIEQLKNLQTKANDETLRCQEIVIADLNRKINMQEKRNNAISKRLKSMDESKEIDEECNSLAENESDALRNQINTLEQDIIAIDEEIKSLNAH